MMINISIKTKLILYSILIQISVISIFSYLLYDALLNISLNKDKELLKVIVYDLKEHLDKQELKLNALDRFDENNEYKIEPLHLAIIDLKRKKIYKTKNFPKNYYIEPNIHIHKKIFYEYNSPFISINYLYQNKNRLLIKLLTNDKKIKENLSQFKDNLLSIIPFILIISLFGSYFIINKSFEPIREISNKLNTINAKKLNCRIELFKNNKNELNSLINNINSLLSRLDLSFQTISQFNQNASHELKTPITIIKGKIEVLLKKDRNLQEYKKELKAILKEIKIMDFEINSIMFLAKSQFENKNKDLIYLDEITLEAVNELKNLANKKEIILETYIKDFIEYYGYGSLLKIAIKNIIKNSINFSPNKSKIIISNYLYDDKKIISIEDFGVGINPKDIDNIFTEFYKSHSNINRESGFGIGLSIVKKIVDIHNAKIEIKNKDIGVIVSLIF